MMDFLEIWDNYKQSHRLDNGIKFDLIAFLNVEKISAISMHNVYWDTLYVVPFQSTDVKHRKVIAFEDTIS